MYNFLQANLILPELSGLQTYMSKELSVVKENVLRFDELRRHLISHGYPSEIHVFEDGTRITNNVSFCLENNTLIGLNTPFNRLTGMPFENFHKANSARNIYDSISNYEKASYVQVLLAQPNVAGKSICV